MTNAEKYKTTEERTKAFREYCNGRKCSECPNREHPATRGCGFAWLDLEAPMTAKEVADILKNPPSPEKFNWAFNRAIELLRNIKE